MRVCDRSLLALSPLAVTRVSGVRRAAAITVEVATRELLIEPLLNALRHHLTQPSLCEIGEVACRIYALKAGHRELVVAHPSKVASNRGGRRSIGLR